MGLRKAVIPVLIGVLCTAPSISHAAAQAPRNAGTTTFFQAPELEKKKEIDQPPAPEPEKPAEAPSADPCAAIVEELDGIVKISLSDAARAGKSLVVSVDDFGDELRLNYDARFDPSGKLQLEAPIFHQNSAIQWEGAGGKSCRQTARFEGFGRAFRAALVWYGPVVLAMHVVEPTGAIGASSHYVSPSHPNLTLDPSSYGFLREYGGREANMHVQVYAVPSGQNPRDKSPVSFHIENVSRGNPVSPPYCGDNPLAHTVFYVIFQQDGQEPKLTRGSFSPLSCGFTWKDRERSFSRQSDMRM
jgi:hypothetical protein